MGPSVGAGGQETKSTSIGPSRRVGGPDVATAVWRARGSSQLSGGLLWGPAQRQAPSLAVWPIRGGRFRGWKPCSPDSGEALPPPVPGLRGLKPLIVQGGLHMLLTPAWTASWGWHSQGATGVQGSHSSDRGIGGRGGSGGALGVKPYLGKGTQTPELRILSERTTHAPALSPLLVPTWKGWASAEWEGALGQLCGQMTRVPTTPTP